MLRALFFFFPLSRRSALPFPPPFPPPPPFFYSPELSTDCSSRAVFRPRLALCDPLFLCAQSFHLASPFLRPTAPAHRSILNDSYRTDVCLLYPPYVIAISALFLALALQQPDAAHAAKSAGAAAAAPAAGAATTNAGSSIAGSGIDRVSASLTDDLVASILASSSSSSAAPPAFSSPSSHAADAPVAAPPTSSFDPAAFLAQFQVSIPSVLSCVKEILAVYPLWEDLDRATKAAAAAAAASSASATKGGETSFSGRSAAAAAAQQQQQRTQSLMSMRIKLIEAAYTVMDRQFALSERDMVTLVAKIQLERALTLRGASSSTGVGVGSAGKRGKGAAEAVDGHVPQIAAKRMAVPIIQTASPA